MKPIIADGSRFLDAQGRHVILHGISMVCKDKSKGYSESWTEFDFQKLQQWGFNFIRLGIIWDGIEPKPGEYDAKYIETVRIQFRMAHRFGIYVMLDMHQDLYSSLFGDGAPAWATLTDGHVYEGTELWSDAYLFNRAVQTAFDHFWSNTPAVDGVGLQDHYISAWHYVVEQLRDEPNLVGYDLMNEPFIGSDVRQMVGAMFSSYGRLAGERMGKVPPSNDELMNMWLDPDSKMQALGFLDSIDDYRDIMQETAPAQIPFERDQLSAFYRKAAARLRQADPERLLFLETNYFSNLGVPSAIEPVQDAAGIRDAQQAFAPHGYDLVTDSDYVHAANGDRVSFIFDSHEITRTRLNMPMLIGEWGAYGESHEAEDASVHVQRNFERLLCSDAYWCYLYPEMDQYSSFHGVCRAYPMETAGTLLSYEFDRVRNAFKMVWDENKIIGAPTRVYVPDMEAMSKSTLSLSPPSSSIHWAPIKGTKAGILTIPPTGAGRRSLAIGQGVSEYSEGSRFCRIFVPCKELL
ncbi:cellulase family glycosylhydrolase [Cohnella soli]|uniref:Cellulase family glycosylhydrolase n=1 Tax=Cohnella soli TaxID=425005 RepID=A0ABW0HXN7_9BACL